METITLEPAKLTSGPTCLRFAFAIDESCRIADREKRRRTVVDRVLGWVEFADVVDEWVEETRRWVSIELPAPVTVEAAEDFCGECPYIVRGSFAVERMAR